MSESLKRGLRDRSKRRHFDSDVQMSLCKNEEGEPYSYAKSYAKVHVVLVLVIREPVPAAEPGGQIAHQIHQQRQQMYLSFNPRLHPLSTGKPPPGERYQQDPRQEGNKTPQKGRKCKG